MTVPVKDDFIWDLKEAVGSTGTKYQNSFDLSSNSHWSSTFMCYEAKQLNILEIVIPNTTVCQNFLTGYTKYPSTLITRSEELEEGDLILMSLNSNNSMRADCVGTVVKYDSDNNSSDIILGDYGSIDPSKSSVGLVTVNMDSKCIKYLIRPAWDEV